MQLSLRPLITTCTVASAYSIHSKRHSGMRSQQARTVTKYSLDRDEAVQKQHLRQFWKKFKHWKKIAALQEGSWFPSLSVSKAQNTVSTLSHTKTHVCSTYPPLASRCFCKYGLFIKVSPAERHGQILSAIFRKLTNSELREVWLLPLECVYSSVCTCVLGSSNTLTLTGIHDLYCSVYVSETGL